MNKSKIELIISSLNRRTKTQFNPTEHTTVKLISQRLSEGYKLADFLRVIDHKCNEWANDSEKRQYLRPEKLFSDKFEIYLQEIESFSTAE